MANNIRPNNLNTRINKTKLDIKQDINSPGTTITDKLTKLTNTFKNIFIGTNNKNNKNNVNTETLLSDNRPNNTVNKHDNPFNNPIMLWSLVIITFGFIIYGLYYYYKTSSTIQPGKSYYGSDLLNYSPVFKMNTEQIDPCINRCKSDALCDGITFNKDELTCVGTKQGTLREDDDSLSAWVKPQLSKDKYKTNKAVILVGFVRENNVISADKISYPGNPYEFNWSLYFNLNDHMENHGSWRHIMHKGSEITDQIDTPNWEDIISQYPDQSVGIWMSPFNNNLRIAITTITTKSQSQSYQHAFNADIDTKTNNIFLTDKPNPPFQDTTKYNTINRQRPTDYEKNIEFFDIYQIPIKKMKHLSVNVLTNTVELYIDGKLYKIFTLVGKPEFNKGNLYIMNSKTVDGYIQNLSYSPFPLGVKDISALVK